MTKLSHIDSLIDELSALRELLAEVEQGSPQWNKFDRLEDKLCADLANIYADWK